MPAEGSRTREGRTMSERFEDRVAVVTGSASGIGEATAARLAAEGATVVAVDRDAVGLAATVAEIVEGGGRAEARELDVSDPDACGGDHGRLDVLANVAGVLRFAHATEHTRADWEQTLAVNLSGPWFLMQAALPHLEATRGNIVNVASAAGLVGQAYTSAYCASKGGLVLLTKSVAVEYAARKVRVNCVCPGQVDTNLLADFAFPDEADQRLLDKLLPLVRGAAPEEIATLIAYLASDDARYVTGAAWPIDGGQTAG
jgi:meso-butanediol dehydrogenase / (S,S)-butanediol dehydrogenase / diacetyl reductase